MLKTISLVPTVFTALFNFTLPEKNEEAEKLLKLIKCVYRAYGHTMYTAIYKVQRVL